MFKDNIPKRDDTGGGRKGNKKSDDANREQAESPVGEKARTRSVSRNRNDENVCKAKKSVARG